MKTLITLMLLLGSLPALAQVAATLMEVEDGDTLVVLLNGQPTRIQLAGIDAPESLPNPKFNLDLKRTGMNAERLRALGEQATQSLQSQLEPGQRLLLHGDLNARDKYGRITADVRTESGQSLSVWLVSQNQARILHPEKLADDLRAALEQTARQASKNPDKDFQRWRQAQ